MKQQIKKCPKCNSLVRGTVVLSGTEGAIQGAAQGIVKSVVNSFTYGVGGTFLDATGSLRKGGDAIREQLTTHTTVEFDCPCGHKWQEVIGNKEENIPHELLQKEKDIAICNCSAKVSSKTTAMIIWGILCALCIWYLIVNPMYIEVSTHNWWSGEDFMRKDIQWGWIGMAFLAAVTAFPFFLAMEARATTNKELKKLKSYSLMAFKQSPLRNKYKN